MQMMQQPAQQAMMLQQPAQQAMPMMAPYYAPNQQPTAATATHHVFHSIPIVFC